MFQTVIKFCLFFHLLKNKQVIINCHINIISLSVVSNIKMAGVKVLDSYCKTKPQRLKDDPVGEMNGCVSSNPQHPRVRSFHCHGDL